MSDFLTSENLTGFVTGAYIIAGLLFIAALAGLAKHETAKQGNIAGMAGMALAIVLVGINSYLESDGFADSVHDVEVFVGVFIGAVTLTGSLVAWAKLSGKMSSSPLTLPGRHWLNLGIIVASLLLMVWFVALGGELELGLVPLLVMTALSLLLGFHLVSAIGGGDMPLVVSMLNSYSR